jgi:ATP-binding cassette, subfamily B, bacterial
VSRRPRRQGRWNDWGERAADLRRTGRALAMIWRSAPGWTSLSALVIAIQSAVTLASLYLLKLIVDAVAAGIAPETADDAGFNRAMLLIGLAAGITIIGVVSRSLAGLAAEAKAQLVTDHMLERLHEKSLAVDFAYYEDPRYYNTLHRAQLEAPFRPTRLLANLTQVIQSAITAVGVLILLATIHWLLATVIVVTVAPVLLVRVRHSRRLHQWQRERSGTEREAHYFGWLIGNAQHAKEFRVFDLGQEILRRFRTLRTVLRDEKLRLATARNVADAGSQMVSTVVVFASLAFIGYQTFQGVLTLGDMVMYFGAMQRGQSLLQALFSGLGNLYEDNLFLCNVDEFLELQPTISAPAEPRPVPDPIREGLRCHGLGFRYPTSPRPVLEDIDLEVHPGEIVALVGPNGSGKTTLTKLLCRLYDPEVGSITLDGIDLREFEPAALRRKFAVVFQDYARYNVSARDNIWFGDIRHPPSLEGIRRAARAAGADAAIERLAHGYDTILGRLFTDGAELSVGEWQKVALARAFLSDAEILVVDEPTSALDAYAEAEVFDALARLFQDRAAIVISHRLSTIRLADRIYFLEQGRIVEHGSHDELMRRRGKYAALFDLQAGPYREEALPLPATRMEAP